MGKIALEIKANLENVSELKPLDEDFRWYLKLKCTSCGEVSSTWQYVCLSENVETKGGRGHASMVQKCKMCGRENHLDIIKDQVKSYQVDNDGKFATIVMFESRGLEPTAWDIRSGWIVLSLCSSTQFSDVDLAENEWYDYDENANQSIGITEIEYKFVKNDSSLMTFEGFQCKGKEEIKKKIMALTFKCIQHNITSLDCQPILGLDNGEAILIIVMGRLQTDQDPPHSFVQTFILRKTLPDSMYIANETFRMILHD